jgi:hypothetical protein
MFFSVGEEGFPDGFSFDVTFPCGVVEALGVVWSPDFV